jgi:hypothetical protein
MASQVHGRLQHRRSRRPTHYTARSKANQDELLELVRAAFTWVAMPERAFDRA